MKLKVSSLAAMTVALFVFTVTSVQADTGTPDILSSVSSGLMQTLSKEESAEVRGEYRFCKWSGRCTGLMYSLGAPPTSMAGYDYRQALYVGPFWVSR